MAAGSRAGLLALSRWASARPILICASTAGTHANRVTAMSQYIEFCEIKGKQPIRIDGLVKTLSKIEIRMNEDIMIDFAVYERWRVSPHIYIYIHI